MRPEVARAVLWGLATTGGLAGLILLGSRRLSRFDAALVAYTFAVLFATFGITYRYAMWLARPSTAVYWRRGWEAFLHRGGVARNLLRWPRRVVEDILLNRFIWSRDRLRWLTHFLLCGAAFSRPRSPFLSSSAGFTSRPCPASSRATAWWSSGSPRSPFAWTRFSPSSSSTASSGRRFS